MPVSFAIEVVPTGSVGAEVKGVDIAAAGPAEIEAIKRAWYRHDVLVFRDQKLSDDDLLAFSRHSARSTRRPTRARAQVARRLPGHLRGVERPRREG
jgi:taurine dioxygenase